LSSDKNINDLVNIDGIGETQLKSIKSFFSNKKNLEVLFELKKILRISNAIQTNKSGSLKDKTFMFTGKLSGISRAEAKSLIEQNSGKIISNVNKKLNFLITGEKPTIKKINIAKNLNIKVITQEEWMEILNKTS
jgi:DNA ligase (NAD+)